MAGQAGINCLLKVGDTATAATTFAVLEGQQSTSFDGSTAVADTTAKDNAGWSTSLATTRSGTVSVSGILYTTRAAFNKLQTAWAAGTSHDCQIVFDSAGAGFKGAFTVTSLQITAETQDVTKYSLTLAPVAALTALP
ncbi:hypothetical protein IGS68_33630 (plasmid) [Skermanella sp. TT6]|uniref:TP901-1 family phage major tail protein n=1 Tax=Skermanella cutis TaxID=2775420 RepID=A0ABX7BHK6_9PROT|nr:phage tail tube protein [Skermanella sp. TT6]QQP93564.1 hypothetical protein IGS68_33630 [Skermanella sp. TT6]